MAWIQKRNRTWWIGWRVGSKQVRKSLGTSDKAVAEAELEKVELLLGQHKRSNVTAALIESLTGQTVSSMPLKSAVSAYLDELGRTVGRSALEAHTSCLNLFLDYVGAGDERPLLRDIGGAVVSDFLNRQRTRVSAATVNGYRTRLNQFFAEALRRGQIATNPVAATRAFKRQPGEGNRRRAFSLDEIRRIHAAAESDFWRWMVVAGFLTGLRLGDLVTLKWQDVDLVGGCLRLIMRKTQRRVVVPMAQPVRDLLSAKWHEGITGPVWPAEAAKYERRGPAIFSREFRDILVRAGLQGPVVRGGKGRSAKREVSELSFHCLRRSFVSMLKLSGASQHVAKRLAGHSSDAVSDLYTDVDQDVLSDAVNRLPSI